MRLSLLALACSLFTALASASSPGEPWRAQWIGVALEEEESPHNQWLCFRGEVTLAEVPPSVPTRIAVDSRYWMWVNGELVVYEGQLKRGPTPRDTYHDTLDLSPHLAPGENSIAVLVWHFGKHGFSHKSSGRAGLVLEAADVELATSARWRARVHPAYGDADPFKPFPNYRLSESDVRFDAREELSDWQLPGYDDGGWPPAVELGSPPCEPWNELVERPTPLLRDVGVREYERLVREPQEDGSLLVRGKLPRNITLHPRLSVRAPAGLSIGIRTDNYKGGGDRNLRHQYVTREGLQSYEALSYLNGHEVRYLLPAGVELLELSYRETRYDADVVGRFESDAAWLADLRQESLNTLWLNLRDGIQDPDRERAQWWGDVVNVLPQLFVTLDARGHAIAEKAVRNLFDWQREDGSLFSPIPSGTWNRELPLQMLAAVGEYGLVRHVLYTEDLELLREVYPHLLRYMDLWELDEHDLVVRRPGEWTWVDWGEDKDVPLCYDGWYHLALRGELRAARWVGDEERARATQEKLERHAAAFRARYARGGEFRSPEHVGRADDRGNALAVLAGLHLPDEARDLEQLLYRHRAASPYMERFVLEALFELGDGTSALRRMHERFGPMLEDEWTTLWERWAMDPRSQSYNHGWSGSALGLASERVAGIEPLEPGHARFRVRPRPGPLRRLSCEVPTVRGPIRLQLERGTDSLELRLDVPANSRAEVELPWGPWARVTLDGAPAPASLRLAPGSHTLLAER